MTRRTGVKMWAVPAVLLLALSACTGNTSEYPSPTTTQSQSQEPIQGETVEIDRQLRMQVPDGWTALTDNIPGLDIYILMVVPADTDLAELEPGTDRPDFAYLTVANLGPTRNGAESYSAAVMESDAENTSSYSDIVALDPVEVDDTTFYGYEGTLIQNGTEAPFQYWHADANDATYKVAIHADADGEFPQDLTDAFKSIDFRR